MGRTQPGNRLQGHFQGQARQLTSSAVGRAILWIPRVRNHHGPQLKTRSGVSAKHRRQLGKMKLVMTSNTFADSYQHTQRGTVILAVTLGMAALFIGLGLAIAVVRPLCITAPILLASAWLCHSLTIEIAGGELRWRFGPGLIRKTVPLAEIISAEPVRTGPSWGIHWSPRLGWLYNVSGWDAVLVTLRSGKKFALGTDEPQSLTARLAEVIRQNPSTGFKA